MRRVLSMLLFCGTAWAAQPEAWRIAGDIQFAPYSYQNEAGAKPQGLDVEIVQAVMAEARIPYQLHLYPWERVKQMLGNGDMDMAFQFAGTAERRAQYELAGPIRTGSTIFMVLKQNSLQNWNTLADLAPLTIGQVHGYAYESTFDKAPLKRDASATNPEQLLLMLLAGRIDLIVGDRGQLLYYARQLRALPHVRILPKPLVEMPRFVAFAKGDSRAAQFNAALARLQQNGKLQTIYNHWQQ